MPLIITILAGLFILLGAVAIKISKNTHKVEVVSFALALGALLALMIFDLVPDIVETIKEEYASWWLCLIFVAVGFGLLILLDHLAPHHEDHHDTPENHDDENAEHIGVMSALAVILHNIVEGMAVYSLALSDGREGLIMAVGIGLHNIPMGMLIFATLSHKSFKSKLALICAVVLSTPVGGLLMMLMTGIFTETLVSILVCIATGMIVYLIVMELLPHVIKTKPVVVSVVSSVVGFALVMLSTILG